MPHPRFEELQTRMYPSAMLHQFGVNGKISGSVFAAGKIKDTLAVIHGPCGCGYHYRYSARRRHAPLYTLVTSDLKEKDIVFGGEERLYQTLVRAAGTYAPALILVIPSPVSDIIQDDIAAVARRASRETGIPVIDAVSEVFSHRDRRYSAKRFKAVAGQKMDKAKPLDFDIRGCGYTEVLCALVDKLMMPQQVRPLTVNLETVAWGARGKQDLADIEKTLNNSGVRVNAFFPAATVEQIRKMPSAQLNIARRIRWARQMKEKFNDGDVRCGRMRHESIDQS